VYGNIDIPLANQIDGERVYILTTWDCVGKVIPILPIIGMVLAT
jgi:hypothetical protein